MPTPPSRSFQQKDFNLYRFPVPFWLLLAPFRLSAKAPLLMRLQRGRYGTEPAALNHSVSSSAYSFDQDPGRVWYNHVAAMGNLQPSTKYYYQVGAGAEASPVFHFRSQVTGATLAANLPQRHVIYGDMGTACAFALCPSCTCNLTCDAAACAKNHSVGLVTEAGLFSDGEEEATMILHVGDFAYNMDDDNGRVGDQFFRNIEQIAAYVPYMVSIGNHENSGVGLAHYTESFRLMPANSGTHVQTQNGQAPNNWYFSLPHVMHEPLVLCLSELCCCCCTGTSAGTMGSCITWRSAPSFTLCLGLLPPGSVCSHSTRG